MIDNNADVTSLTNQAFYTILRVLRFPQRCCWRFKSSRILRYVATDVSKVIALKISETVYPAIQYTNPEDLSLKAFLYYMYCNILQRCYFLNCLASHSFHTKDFRSCFTHHDHHMHFLLNYGSVRNTVRVTKRRSILFRLKTLVHESETILNTNKTWAPGLSLYFSITCLFQTLRQSAICIFSHTVYFRLSS